MIYLRESFDFINFEDDEFDDPTLKDLATALCVSLETIFDRVKAENYYDFVHICAIMGEEQDFSLSTNGPMTGVDFELKLYRDNDCEINWKILNTAGEYRGKNIGRKVCDIFDRFREDNDLELTMIGDDISQGYWNKIKPEYPRINWKFDEVVY